MASCGTASLKMKRMFSTGPKKSGVTRPKILSFLMRQRKDKVNGLETQFSDSQPSAPPRARPFLHNIFPSEQTLSANNNVSVAKKDRLLSHISQKFCSSKKGRKIIENVKGNEGSEFFKWDKPLKVSKIYIIKIYIWKREIYIYI